MRTLALSIFAASIACAAIGNAAVLLVLIVRKIPLRFIWAGAPFYLYRVCNRATPPTSRALRAFALSTNIAFLLAIPTWIWFEAVSA